MSIVATHSVSGFFHGVVEEAIKAKGVDATHGAATYLVCLLSEFAHPDNRAEETLARPLAFLLDEAMHTAAPAERFERLRSLGDGVLYSCGFFGDHFEARGVDQKYLIGIGSVAYGAASSMLRIPTDGTSATRRAPHQDAEKACSLDIYRELADKFGSFVDVIAEIADTTIAQGVAGSRDVLKIYERWLKTGSDRLAQTLTAHGLLPTRGSAKGVLQ